MRPPSLLFAAWQQTCAAAPTAPILLPADAEGWLTRADVEARAHTAWADLAPRRIGPGHRVVVRALRAADWLATALAVWREGGVLVPLDSSAEPTAARALARRLHARVFWSPPQPPESLPGARPLRGDGLAVGKLTSGTTGDPRTFWFTAAEMIADGRQIVAGMGLRPTDRNFGLVPLSHSYGLGNLVVPLVTDGLPLVEGSTALPGVMAREIARGGATVFPATPVMLAALARSSVEPDDLASLRLVISAGAVLAPAVAEAFANRFGRPVHNFYGSSETGGIAFDPTGEAACKGIVGPPLPGVTVRAGNPLRVWSPAVHTHRNRQHQDDLGAMNLPDIGHLDDRGRLVLTGRRRTLKLGARRFDPAAVERVVRAFAGVREAWVEVSAQGGRDQLDIFAGGDAAEAGLRAHLRRELPRWQRLGRVVVMPAFPVNARGKLDRAALRALCSEASPPPPAGQ